MRGRVSSQSCRYMFIPRPSCLKFERQVVARAFSRAWAKTGNRIAARMAIIAITTRSSIRVKAEELRRLMDIGYSSFLSKQGRLVRSDEREAHGRHDAGRTTADRPAEGCQCI